MYLRLCLAWAVIVCAFPVPVIAAEEGQSQSRRIEEVIVTAERKESTVSDTSISITAFTGEMLEDFRTRSARICGSIKDTSFPRSSGDGFVSS